MKNTESVFCLGHISIDIIVSRDALNSLKIGGSIDSENLQMQTGGVSANTAFWLGIQRVPVTMIGVIGKDASGKFLKDELEKVGVKCYLKYSKYPSSVILTVVESDGERSFIINGMSQRDLYWEDLPIKKILSGKFFYSYAYTLQDPPISDTMLRLYKELKEKKKNQSINMFNLAAHTTVKKCILKIKNDVIPYTDIVVGNMEEFKALFSDKFDFIDIFNDLKAIHDEYKGILLMTNGKDGCYYYSTKEHGNIPALNIKPVDTTGAGDGFCAGFIAGYMEGKSVKEAVRKGVILGSKICLGYGAKYNADQFLKNDKKK